MLKGLFLLQIWNEYPLFFLLNFFRFAWCKCRRKKKIKQKMLYFTLAVETGLKINLNLNCQLNYIGHIDQIKISMSIGMALIYFLPDQRHYSQQLSLKALCIIEQFYVQTAITFVSSTTFTQF